MIFIWKGGICIESSLQNYDNRPPSDVSGGGGGGGRGDVTGGVHG